MKVLKWIGIVVGALCVLIVAGVGLIYWKSGRVIARTYSVPEVSLAVPSDSATIARGRHLGTAVAKCGDCHGENLGGTLFIDGMPFARVAAPNLTRGRGGVGGSRSDAELMRAIRHGVGPGGRGLVIMPSEAYIHLSDADLAAVVAWVRSMPDVDNELPAPAFGPIGRMVLATTDAPLFPAAYVQHDRVAPYAAPADTTVAYGRYLSWIGGCHACHNPALSGGDNAGGPPGSPITANITPGGLPDWTEEEFLRLLREGKGRGGRDVNNDHMPWRSTGKMTDAEIHALYRYLRSVPAKQLGET